MMVRPPIHITHLLPLLRSGLAVAAVAMVATFALGAGAPDAHAGGKKMRSGYHGGGSHYGGGHSYHRGGHSYHGKRRGFVGKKRSYARHSPGHSYRGRRHYGYKRHRPYGFRRYHSYRSYPVGYYPYRYGSRYYNAYPTPIYYYQPRYYGDYYSHYYGYYYPSYGYLERRVRHLERELDAERYRAFYWRAWPPYYHPPQGPSAEGSCLYGADEQLLYKPQGKTCSASLAAR